MQKFGQSEALGANWAPNRIVCREWGSPDRNRIEARGGRARRAREDGLYRLWEISLGRGASFRNDFFELRFSAFVICALLQRISRRVDGRTRTHPSIMANPNPTNPRTRPGAARAQARSDAESHPAVPVRLPRRPVLPRSDARPAARGRADRHGRLLDRAVPAVRHAGVHRQCADQRVLGDPDGLAAARRARAARAVDPGAGVRRHRADRGARVRDRSAARHLAGRQHALAAGGGLRGQCDLGLGSAGVHARLHVGRRLRGLSGAPLARPDAAG
ncbi:hypothetical protein BGLA2_1720031 [Burkholderia gladioli]|nr:hypothetical protein BGLA2_1720031 [Burkholderia gladioli]